MATATAARGLLPLSRLLLVLLTAPDPGSAEPPQQPTCDAPSVCTVEAEEAAVEDLAAVELRVELLQRQLRVETHEGLAAAELRVELLQRQLRMESHEVAASKVANDSAALKAEVRVNASEVAAPKAAGVANASAALEVEGEAIASEVAAPEAAGVANASAASKAEVVATASEAGAAAEAAFSVQLLGERRSGNPVGDAAAEAQEAAKAKVEEEQEKAEETAEDVKEQAEQKLNETAENATGNAQVRVIDFKDVASKLISNRLLKLLEPVANRTQQLVDNSKAREAQMVEDVKNASAGRKSFGGPVGYPPWDEPYNKTDKQVKLEAYEDTVNESIGQSLEEFDELAENISNWTEVTVSLLLKVGQQEAAENLQAKEAEALDSLDLALNDMEAAAIEVQGISEPVAAGRKFKVVAGRRLGRVNASFVRGVEEVRAFKQEMDLATNETLMAVKGRLQLPENNTELEKVQASLEENVTAGIVEAYEDLASGVLEAGEATGIKAIPDAIPPLRSGALGSEPIIPTVVVGVICLRFVPF